MAFADTPNKRAIRVRYDLPILELWRTEKRRNLTYFGLTGPDIHDLIDWQHVLDRKRTAVESPGKDPQQREIAKETKRRMNVNVMNLPNNGSSGVTIQPCIGA